MKGILLAGGMGSRLYPMSIAISKHLLNIYDKPMIYYSLSVMIQAGIREILIISRKRDIPMYQCLLGDGSKYGVQILYAVQEEPNGIAEAFLIGEEFIGQDCVCLVLGDNFFLGESFDKAMKAGTGLKEGASIFGYRVKDPERYGVVKFDGEGTIAEIVEKPESYVSDIAVAGIYFYDNDVVKIAHTVRPSERGELEITDINNVYLKNKKLGLHILEKEVRWIDTGTFDSLKEASDCIAEYEKRTGKLVACLEEIAYRNGYISRKQMEEMIAEMPDFEYKEYLSRLLQEG